METVLCYESYPWWIILLSSLVSLAIIAIGAFLIYQLGLTWMIVYLLFILLLEVRLLRGSCVSCYYHGKACAFGKGKVSSLFFKKGDHDKFNQKEIGWKDMIPDIMVALIPLVVGIVLLIRDFSWLVLVMVVLLLLLASLGNAWIRGSLACRYCRQREIGCPAEQLFRKA
jgi:hypothetical protein